MIIIIIIIIQYYAVVSTTDESVIALIVLNLQLVPNCTTKIFFIAIYKIYIFLNANLNFKNIIIYVYA